MSEGSTLIGRHVPSPQAESPWSECDRRDSFVALKQILADRRESLVKRIQRLLEMG
jgi:hypothetical protein